MKIKHLMLIAAFIAIMGLARNAMAHGDEPHAEVEATAAVTPQAAESNNLQALQSIFSTIDASLKENNLKALHELTEAGLKAAKELREKTTPPEAGKTRFDSAINQLIAQIGKLHTASDANDQAASEAEFKKAQGALKLVEISIK